MRDYENYRRIAAFLDQYVSWTDGGNVPQDPLSIAEALYALITEGGYTADELRRKALEEYRVMIPAWLFVDPEEIERRIHDRKRK